MRLRDPGQKLELWGVGETHTENAGKSVSGRRKVQPC